MRNIKKLLALMLVMVMALGMVPMVASASDNGFTDADDIEFIEAAGLLDELGIIQGYTDDSFRPAQSVTRAEAVAFIVRMLLTFEVAQRLPDNRSSFTDVLSNPSVAWAAGEIEYAFGEGIVLGRGEGLFDPQGDVTGIEMAAFLLRALGKGAYNNPSTWAINAVADGTKEGILTIGPDVDLSGPANREQVALYTFNSLFVDSEDAVMKTSYVIRGFNGEGLDGEAFDSFLEALMAGQSTNGDFVSASVTLTSGKFTIDSIEEELVAAKGGLIDSVFNIRPTQGFDDFRRPTIEYRTIGSNPKTIFTAAVEPVARYEASVNQATMFSAFGGTGNTLSGVEHYVDGDTKGTLSLSRTSTLATAAGATDSGRGVVTELYSINNVNRIVTINTWIGQITSVRPASGSTSRLVHITGRNGRDVFAYETDDFASNDWVVFTVAATDEGDVVQSIAAIAPAVTGVSVTSTTGTVNSTSGTGNTGSFVAGGTTYNFNKNSGTGTDAVVASATATFDLFLDAYGFVLYARAASAGPPSYLYVPPDESPLHVGVTTWEFRAVFTNGDVEIIRGAKLEGSTRDEPDPNTIYTFTIRDGVYTLTEVEDQVNSGGTLASVSLSSRLSIGGSPSDGYFGNSATTYVLGSVEDGFASFTGSTRAPGFSGATDGKWAFVCNTSGSTLLKSVAVLFVAGGSIDGSLGRSAVVLNAGRVLRGDLEVSSSQYYEYIAFVDGERTTLRYGANAHLFAGSAPGTNDIWKGPSLNVDVDSFSRVRLGDSENSGVVSAIAPTGTAPAPEVWRVTAEEDSNQIMLSKNTNGSGAAPHRVINDPKVISITINSATNVTINENATVANVLAGDTIVFDKNSAGEITTIYVFKASSINASAFVVGAFDRPSGFTAASITSLGSVSVDTLVSGGAEFPDINDGEYYTVTNKVWRALTGSTWNDNLASSEAFTGKTTVQRQFTLTAENGYTFRGTNITNATFNNLITTSGGATIGAISLVNNGFELIVRVSYTVRTS